MDALLSRPRSSMSSALGLHAVKKRIAILGSTGNRGGLAPAPPRRRPHADESRSLARGRIQLRCVRRARNRYPPARDAMATARRSTSCAWRRGRAPAIHGAGIDVLTAVATPPERRFSCSAPRPEQPRRSGPAGCEAARSSRSQQGSLVMAGRGSSWMRRAQGCPHPAVTVSQRDHHACTAAAPATATPVDLTASGGPFRGRARAPGHLTAADA